MGADRPEKAQRKEADDDLDQQSEVSVRQYIETNLSQHRTCDAHYPAERDDADVGGIIKSSHQVANRLEQRHEQQRACDCGYHTLFWQSGVDHHLLEQHTGTGYGR